MLPRLVREAVGRYLDRVDRDLPDRIQGFYVVGSTALGGFRPNDSDIDFVAVVATALDERELEVLRTIQSRLYRGALAAIPIRLPRKWPLVCNGVFVRWNDLTKSALEVVPIASHVGGEFSIGRGFDVNPVTWRILSDRGIAVRGPESLQLHVYRDDVALRNWTLGNLNTYWRRWAKEVRAGHGWPAIKALLRRYVAWGVLGASRMHFTIATGDIASKEEAGAYALRVFGTRWHPVLEEALAYRRGLRSPAGYGTPYARRRDAADFVMTVIESPLPQP
jgi:predicted nucleotidyltransferase